MLQLGSEVFMTNFRGPILSVARVSVWVMSAATFDAIFDRIPGSQNTPSLLRWGLHQTIHEDGQPRESSIRKKPKTPRILTMAKHVNYLPSLWTTTR